MDPEAVKQLIDEDRREWAALCDVLDAHPESALHDPESPAWTARDVYAHLARWITHSTNDLEAVLSGGGITVLEGSDDEINARWQREDSVLSFGQARERAQRAFDRRIGAIEGVPSDRWNDAAAACARADGAEHYRAHRSFIKVA